MPSHQLGGAYFARPVDTYATVLPVIDCDNLIMHG